MAEEKADPTKTIEFWQGEAKSAFVARDEAKKAVADLAAKTADLEKQLKGFTDSQAKTAAEAAKAAEAAQRAQLEKEGKYQEIIAGAEAKHKAELDVVRQAASKRLLGTAIVAAASRLDNLSAEARADLPYLLRDQVRINPETFDVEVLDEAGKPAQTLKENKLVAVTLDEHLASFVAKRPYMLLDAMASGTGVKPGAGAKAVTTTYTMAAALKNPKLLEEWQKADPEGFAKAQAEFGSPAAMVARAKEKLTGHA